MTSLSGYAAFFLTLGVAFIATSCKSRCSAAPEPPAATASTPDVKLNTRPYTVRGKRYVPMSGQKALGFSETGIATYYSASGRRGALGKSLGKQKYYAAHKTLPMPCVVRVTNLSNGKSCLVTIVDRGPFTRGRIIDVSREAAKELDFIRKGTTRVRIEVVRLGY